MATACAFAGISLIGQHRQAEQAGQDDDERHAHLEGRADDGRHLRGAQILGGEHALHHQEVGGPVAEGDHRSRGRSTMPVQWMPIGLSVNEPSVRQRWV